MKKQSYTAKELMELTLTELEDKTIPLDGENPMILCDVCGKEFHMAKDFFSGRTVKLDLCPIAYRDIDPQAEGEPLVSNIPDEKIYVPHSCKAKA